MSSFLDTRISRRRLMAAAGTSLLATSLATPAMTPPPSDVGRKFLRSRRPMPFAGNTFVGHLEQQGDGYDSFDRVLNIYRQFPEQRFAHKFAVLPPSSYHVTLLGGVNEIDRARGPWPSDLPRDHALADINAAYLARLKERAAPPLGACRFLVNPTAARTGNNDNLLIPLKPADTPGTDATDTFAAPRLHQLPVSYFAGLPVRHAGCGRTDGVSLRGARLAHTAGSRGADHGATLSFLYVQRHGRVSHGARGLRLRGVGGAAMCAGHVVSELPAAHRALGFLPGVLGKGLALRSSCASPATGALASPPWSSATRHTPARTRPASAAPCRHAHRSATDARRQVCVSARPRRNTEFPGRAASRR